MWIPKCSRSATHGGWERPHPSLLLPTDSCRHPVSPGASPLPVAVTGLLQAHEAARNGCAPHGAQLPQHSHGFVPLPQLCSGALRQVHSSPPPALQQVQLHPALISKLFQQKRVNTHQTEQALRRNQSAEQKEPPAAVSSVDTHIGEKIFWFPGKSCRHSV